MNNKGVLITFLIGILIGGIISYWVFSSPKPQDSVYKTQADSAAKAITILQDSLELIVRNDSAIMDQMRVLQANDSKTIIKHEKIDNAIDTLDGNSNTEQLRSNIGSHKN